MKNWVIGYHLRIDLVWLALALWTGSSMAADLEQVAGTNEPLRVSVYTTAGDVLRYMATEPDCEQVIRMFQPLRISRLFLEGRRGDEYVSPALLRKLRAFFEARGIQCSGGIATVPGPRFGVRQNEALGW